jgi:class 3 adenylate cyclase
MTVACASVRECLLNVFEHTLIETFGDIARETRAFVEGGQPDRIPDSVLATVLSTDLVGSTERAAALGDRAWRDLLTRHHEDVRRELARFRGEEVDSAGDGFFCRFDGPARAIACARAIVTGARERDLAFALASTPANARS